MFLAPLNPSVCACFQKNFKISTLPNIYLGNNKLDYVETFTYLSHVIASNGSDNDDINKEMRKLCVQGNTLIRKFKFCNLDVKVNLFRSYCHSFYCCSLWANYNVSVINKVKVVYNNIMRKLANVPVYSSASFLFGWLGVKSFQEVRRNACYSIMQRILESNNSLIVCLRSSAAKLCSKMWHLWHSLLYIDF